VPKLKVPEVVVSRLGLGNLAVRLWFACVNDIRKFDGVPKVESINFRNWLCHPVHERNE